MDTLGKLGRVDEGYEVARVLCTHNLQRSEPQRYDIYTLKVTQAGISPRWRVTPEPGDNALTR